MSKIKLTEAQVVMLQKRVDDLDKKKVLKINENQYERLFKGGFNKPSEAISKDLKNNDIKESEEKDDINPLEFAQELIVFIKDVIANPKRVPFSNYWENLGMTRKELFELIKKEGLLTQMVGEGNVKSYKAKKIGFRKGIKELCKKIMENQLNEAGGGYPTGAEFDPNAPWNQNDGQDNRREGQGEVVKNKPLQNVYFGERSDDLMIFKAGNGLYAFIASNVPEDNYMPFMDFDGIVDEKAIDNYVNSGYLAKQIKVSANINDIGSGQLIKITPEVKEKLIGWYGDDGEMVNLLNQLPESTGASSSGAFVGGMSGGPIQKNTGIAPEDAMKDLNEGGIDPTYTHFAIYKPTGKIVDGWEYNGLDKDEVTYYTKIDLKDNFPDNKLNDFKVSTKGFLKKQGIDPSDTNNWGRPNMEEGVTNGINEDMARNQFKITYNLEDNGGDSSPFFDEFHQVQEYMNYLEKKGIVTGVQVSKTDESGKVIKSFMYDFNGSGWDKRETPMAETTSMGGAGGINAGNGGDSIEYDVNAFGNSKFMKAGNKLNKEEAMPIVKRSIGVNEGVTVGQIYMNGSGRAKIEKIIDRKNIQIRRWGDTEAKTINIGTNELGGWTLLEGKVKVLKLTESQVKMLAEYDGSKEGRYVAEMEFYVYADSDDKAKAYASAVARDLDVKTDNGARITKLVRQPQGTMGNSPVNMGESVKKKQ